MTDHPLERPDCPCGGEHYYADCPSAQPAQRFTVRVVLLNPREPSDRRYYVADIDEDGAVVDAAWVGPRSRVPSRMSANHLTGDPCTIHNVGDFLDRGWLVSEREHLRATQTTVLPDDPFEVMSRYA